MKRFAWVGALILLMCLGSARIDRGSRVQAVFTPVLLSSTSIAITPDGTTLVVANPDSNSVSLVDTLNNTLVQEIGVGVDPRGVAVAADGVTAYVVNQGSDSLSVIDIPTRTRLADLPTGDRPVSVVCTPDGRFVIVAEMGADAIRFMDAGGLATLSVVPVGDRPYGLAVTPDGRRLLVTHLLSGQVTVLKVQPFSSYLPLISHSLRTRTVSLATASPSDSQPLVLATWPNVAPAPAVAINAAGTRAYLPQTMANGLGLNQTFDTSVFPKVSVLGLDTNTHLTSEHISLPETDQPVGLPWAVALAKNDSQLWVVNAASNDVSVIDITSPTHPARAAHILVGDQPRGIVFSPDGGSAYVNNTLAGTVSVIDAQTYTVSQVIQTTILPLPPALLNGKKLFFSSARPDLAQARWISCNTCHIEGEADGRTWKVQYLGTVPPGEQPLITRNTTSLLGMVETYPLRWSAEWDESADSEFSVRFEQFGTGLILGDIHPTLGTPNQGRSYDLDCLALYLDSLAVPPRTHDLTDAELRGKALFESPDTGCATCHPAPLYTDLQVHDVGTAGGPGEWFGPEIDTPTLRYLYDSAPYLHDGSAASLVEVLVGKNPADEHGVTSHLTSAELQDLIAYLLSLPY